MPPWSINALSWRKERGILLSRISWTSRKPKIFGIWAWHKWRSGFQVMTSSSKERKKFFMWLWSGWKEMREEHAIFLSCFVTYVMFMCHTMIFLMLFYHIAWWKEEKHVQPLYLMQWKTFYLAQKNATLHSHQEAVSRHMKMPLLPAEKRKQCVTFRQRKSGTGWQIWQKLCCSHAEIRSFCLPWVLVVVNCTALMLLWAMVM